MFSWFHVIHITCSSCYLIVVLFYTFFRRYNTYIRYFLLPWLQTWLDLVCQMWTVVRKKRAIKGAYQIFTVRLVSTTCLPCHIMKAASVSLANGEASEIYITTHTDWSLPFPSVISGLSFPIRERRRHSNTIQSVELGLKNTCFQSRSAGTCWECGKKDHFSNMDVFVARSRCRRVI